MPSRKYPADPWVLRNLPFVILIPTALVSVILVATNASDGWWLLAPALVLFFVVGVVARSMVKAVGKPKRK